MNSSIIDSSLIECDTKKAKNINNTILKNEDCVILLDESIYMSDFTEYSKNIILQCFNFIKKNHNLMTKYNIHTITNFTLIFFNAQQHIMISRENIDNITEKRLNEILEGFNPYGKSNALLDTLGDTIQHYIDMYVMGKFDYNYCKMCVISTGEENSSVKYNDMQTMDRIHVAQQFNIDVLFNKTTEANVYNNYKKNNINNINNINKYIKTNTNLKLPYPLTQTYSQNMIKNYSNNNSNNYFLTDEDNIVNKSINNNINKDSNDNNLNKDSNDNNINKDSNDDNNLKKISCDDNNLKQKSCDDNNLKKISCDDNNLKKISNDDNNLKQKSNNIYLKKYNIAELIPINNQQDNLEYNKPQLKRLISEVE